MLPNAWEKVTFPRSKNLDEVAGKSGVFQKRFSFFELSAYGVLFCLAVVQISNK